MYRLKPGQESFEVVDGPAAGLSFKRNKVYDGQVIPKNEAWRFEKIPSAPEKKPAAGIVADKQAAESKKTVKTEKKGA